MISLAQCLQRVCRHPPPSQCPVILNSYKFSTSKTGCVPSDHGDTGSKCPILHIDASPSSRSLVSLASERLFQDLGFPFTLEKRNLWQDQAMISYNLTHVAAKMRVMKGKGSDEDKELCRPVLQLSEELNKSQILVISSPMWNFSFPYVLKQYIDIAVQPGVNFEEHPERPVTSNKCLVMITSSGGNYGDVNPRDYLHPYLEDIFGMLGYDKCYAIKIQGAAQMSREKLIEFSQVCTADVAKELSSQFATDD